MKFFTPDLVQRFGSQDEGVAHAALEEFEQRAKDYAHYLKSIKSKLPARFRKLQERYYLHDARVLHFPMVDPPPLPLPGWWAVCNSQNGKAASSFWLIIQMDTPPHEYVVLHYLLPDKRAIKLNKTPSAEECPYLEWLYDEVEIANNQKRSRFTHNILFTNGIQLRVNFVDFDFATLRPWANRSGKEHRQKTKALKRR